MIQISFRSLPIIFLALLVFGCNDNKNPSTDMEQQNVAFDLDEAKNIIQEKTKRFTEAHILKDTAYLNNIVTNDARSFPPNSETVSGQKAISQLNYEWVNYGIQEFNEESTAFYGNEDYLIDEGTYYLRYGENNTIDKGKYINIWKMENGEWKIYSNMWNTSLPMVTSEKNN